MEIRCNKHLIQRFKVVQTTVSYHVLSNRFGTEHLSSVLGTAERACSSGIQEEAP